jgi:hypothetical protein
VNTNVSNYQKGGFRNYANTSAKELPMRESGFYVVFHIPEVLNHDVKRLSQRYLHVISLAHAQLV